MILRVETEKHGLKVLKIYENDDPRISAQKFGLENGLEASSIQELVLQINTFRNKQEKMKYKCSNNRNDEIMVVEEVALSHLESKDDLINRIGNNIDSIEENLKKANTVFYDSSIQAQRAGSKPTQFINKNELYYYESMRAKEGADRELKKSYTAKSSSKDKATLSFRPTLNKTSRKIFERVVLILYKSPRVGCIAQEMVVASRSMKSKGILIRSEQQLILRRNMLLNAGSGLKLIKYQIKSSDLNLGECRFAK